MLHCPVGADTVMFDGQVTVGTWLSTTVTVKEQVAVKPDASVAIAVTVVVPAPNTLPLAGLTLTVEEQLSVEVTL